MVHLQCLKPYFLTWSLYCRILWAFFWTIAVLPKKCMVQSLAMYDCCEILLCIKYFSRYIFFEIWTMDPLPAFFFCHTLKPDV